MPLVLRSEYFKPLLEPISKLPGVGEKLFPRLVELARGSRIIDLLLLLPHRYINRTTVTPIGHLAAFYSNNEDSIVPVVEGQVISITRPPKRTRAPIKIRIEDTTGKIDISIFNHYLPDTIKEGNWIAVSGPLKIAQGRISINSPSYIVPLQNKNEDNTLSCRNSIPIPLIEPVWPLATGLNSSVVGKAILNALPLIKEIPEWLHTDILRQQEWPSFSDALSIIHRPELISDCDDWRLRITKAKERLAADELLADQLCLQTARYFSKKIKGRAVITNEHQLQKTLWKNFNFKPTLGQAQAIREIIADLKSDYPMMRLLQGDVGSGKTMAAFTAMAFCADAGFQSALMAPTEILAKQHYQALSRLLPGETISLLTGSLPSQDRKEALQNIASGAAKFIIGTHALFQEEVLYKNLALTIIDEQHRFGVEQRETFSKKGYGTNVLLMSATPIPRTLQITQWGGVEVSRIKEKPSSRIPTVTTLHSIQKMDLLISSIKRAISKGEQIFWVCPLVEESESLSVTAVKERFTYLKHFFPGLISLSHGQQDTDEKAKALNDFKNGKTRILIATTVIEVGVDVPQANIIVIEHAERFGLAQLHQLRGRVGRGSAASHCLLLYGDEAGDLALQRLRLLRVTDDGFKIADEDFKLRGGGEMTGTRQAGIRSFKIANLTNSQDLLEKITKEAKETISTDPYFKSIRGTHLVGLMHLFDRHEPEKVLFSA